MGCSGCGWDPNKDAKTQRERGIAFEDACCVFEDPNRDEYEDDRDYGEDRWVATGRVGMIVLVVAFTERDGINWIISARKAEPREDKDYYARLARNRRS